MNKHLKETNKIFYLLIVVFMFLYGMECQAQTVSGNKGGHDYVDLGLPSGRLWATCNVGANEPAGHGNFFAWGETDPKKNYSKSNYKWNNGVGYSKYVMSNKNGKADDLRTLESADDAATANWGADWRMPTHSEQQELIDGCRWEWTSNGFHGVSKTNGNSIFLPAAGGFEDSDHWENNATGFYWSSSLFVIYSSEALNLSFSSEETNCTNEGDRFNGFSVRAVVK